VLFGVAEHFADEAGGFANVFVDDGGGDDWIGEGVLVVGEVKLAVKHTFEKVCLETACYCSC